MSLLLFRLTAVAATVFVITILAMIAMLVGDPDAPVNVWFNAHGGTVLVCEIVVVVVAGLAAMTADRRETLRKQAQLAITSNPVRDDSK